MFILYSDFTFLVCMKAKYKYKVNICVLFYYVSYRHQNYIGSTKIKKCIVIYILKISSSPSGSSQKNIIMGETV